MGIGFVEKKMETAAAISNMLKENTGRHMLDSGSIYGYGYEARKDVDYLNTPDHYIKDGSYFKSTFHHLMDNLTVDTEENERFMRFAELPVNEDVEWSLVLKAYCQMMHYTATCSNNTYNSGHFLDVDFNWHAIEDKENYNDRELVVIRTHNGCDLRGGYSTPVWFTYNEGNSDDSNFLSFDVGYLYCSEDEDHRFESYDAYNWVDSDSGSESVDIVTDDNGNFICPSCGGILKA